MKSVGEAMALGRSFPEALGKALRSMEDGRGGFWTADPDPDGGRWTIARPTDGRIYAVERALRARVPVAEGWPPSPGSTRGSSTRSPRLVGLRAEIEDAPVLDETLLRRAKRAGLSDRQLAALRPEFAGEDGVRTLRHRLGDPPGLQDGRHLRRRVRRAHALPLQRLRDRPGDRVGDRAADRAAQGADPRLGPNRIGQGIEFDYSCVHAVMALRSAPDNNGAGFETVMVNCNPETVSTDYDTADRLYFEPLTFEDVLEVVHAEQVSGRWPGVIVQLGGQTPLGLAQRLTAAGVPVVGTSAAAIDLAEDRGAFGEVLPKAGLPAPAFGTATSFDEAREIAERIGYPVLVRPSYVLGGRGMEIVYDEQTLAGYIARATGDQPGAPVLVDRFLDDAIEIDVDALCDGGRCSSAASWSTSRRPASTPATRACTLPPITLGRTVLAEVRRSTEAIAHGIGVRGLLNVQYALHGETLYVLEANPRASRTVPFVSKATAVPLAKAAARIMLGASIAELRAEGLLPAEGDGGELPPDAPIAVKEAVLPFNRFRTPDGQGVDPLLGPEMKSTGEVMGIDASFGAGVREVAGRGLRVAAHVGAGVRVRRRPGQAGHGVPGAAAGRPRLRGAGHRRHRRRAAPARHGHHGGAQALRGRRDRARPDPGRAHRHDHQHPVRQLGPAHRRLRDPLGGGGARHPVHHHGAGRGGRGAGHRGDERGGRIGVRSLQDVHAALQEGPLVNGEGAT